MTELVVWVGILEECLDHGTLQGKGGLLTLLGQLRSGERVEWQGLVFEKLCSGHEILGYGVLVERRPIKNNGYEWFGVPNLNNNPAVLSVFSAVSAVLGNAGVDWVPILGAHQYTEIFSTHSLRG